MVAAHLGMRVHEVGEMTELEYMGWAAYLKWYVKLMFSTRVGSI